MHEQPDLTGRTPDDISIVLSDGFLKIDISGPGEHNAGQDNGEDDKWKDKCKEPVEYFCFFGALHMATYKRFQRKLQKINAFVFNGKNGKSLL